MRKTFRLSVIAVMAASLTLVAVAAFAGGTKESSSPSASVIKIAFLYPLSGNNADVGRQNLDAAKLAVHDVNAAGGIKALDGKQVELVVGDTTSGSNEGKTVAERIFSSNTLAGAVGAGISGITLPILPVAEKYRIPIITNSISDAITSQGYKYVFETVPKASMFGAAQVNFLKALNTDFNLGIHKVGIVYSNDAYGVSTAKGVRNLAKKAGLDIVFDQSFKEGFTDASPLVTALKQSGAQAIFPAAYTTDAELIINAMKAMNYSPLVIGGGSGFIWPDIGKALGNNVNGLISVASWNWDSKNISGNPSLEKIPAEFEKTYGYFMPEQSGACYVAVMLLAQAMEHAKSANSVKVRDALAQMTFTTGPATLMQPGKIKFDQNGWNEDVHPVMIQWQHGKPETIFPLSDAVTKILPPQI